MKLEGSAGQLSRSLIAEKLRRSGRSPAVPADRSESVGTQNNQAHYVLYHSELDLSILFFLKVLTLAAHTIATIIIKIA